MTIATDMDFEIEYPLKGTCESWMPPAAIRYGIGFEGRHNFEQDRVGTRKVEGTDAVWTVTQSESQRHTRPGAGLGIGARRWPGSSRVYHLLRTDHCPQPTLPKKKKFLSIFFSFSFPFFSSTHFYTSSKIVFSARGSFSLRTGPRTL